MSLPSNLDTTAEKIVLEMGFSRTEVNMALKDTNGNVEKAVEKLMSGDYAPPPYAHSQQGAASYNPPSVNKRDSKHNDNDTRLYPSMTNFISGLTNRDKAPIVAERDPTAPPLFVDISASSDSPDFSKIDYMPPPYQKIEKENKIKDWEVSMNVIHLNTNKGDNSGFAPLPAKDQRCPVCFNGVQSAGGSTSQQEIISHNGKIFHNSCFQRKHGPKCAYCCFPLGQADKDHELSGKYLVYKDKDYHVECYEKYAGPRCTSCFNVIIEKPNGEFSGNWVVDNNHEYHMECLQKKLYAQWRAKHS